MVTVTDSFLLSKLPPFKNDVKVLAKNQTTADIINGILQAHEMYQDDYRRIAPYFIGNTSKETIENIFAFLKNHVRYVIEPGIKQTIKSPAAIIATGNSGSDCKNYALFTAGILRAANKYGVQNIPYAFRFAGYKFGSSDLEHVFVVAFPGTKREIWIDAVLPRLDDRTKYPYIYKDYKFKDMALMGISGVNQAPAVQMGANDLVRLFNKPLRQALIENAEMYAPAFLYMWINPGADRWRKFAPISASNPDLFTQLNIPRIVKEKQNRAADYFVKLKEAANMKDEELWQAIESGFVKKYGKKPSELANMYLRGEGAAIIGFDPITAAATAKGILENLRNIFGGKVVSIDEREVATFIPEPADWKGWRSPLTGKGFGLFADTLPSFLATRTTNLPAPTKGAQQSDVLERFRQQTQASQPGTTQAGGNMFLTIALVGAGILLVTQMGKKRR